MRLGHCAFHARTATTTGACHRCTMFAPTAELRDALESLADGERATGMAAYMRDQFVFLGISAKDRRAVAKPWLRLAKQAEPEALLDLATWCWSQPEREFHHVGTDALRAGAAHLRAGDLDAIRGFITTHSWWDTVDSLAAWTVGPMVTNHDLGERMDTWVHDDNLWVARTAILHQLGYKDATDADRLFRYADLRAADTDFFIRKAIGWALRQYARVAPDEVRAFVDPRRDALSGLTVREAMKHLD